MGNNPKKNQSSSKQFFFFINTAHVKKGGADSKSPLKQEKLPLLGQLTGVWPHLEGRAKASSLVTLNWCKNAALFNTLQRHGKSFSTAFSTLMQHCGLGFVSPFRKGKHEERPATHVGWSESPTETHEEMRIAAIRSSDSMANTNTERKRKKKSRSIWSVIIRSKLANI